MQRKCYYCGEEIQSLEEEASELEQRFWSHFLELKEEFSEETKTLTSLEKIMKASKKVALMWACISPACREKERNQIKEVIRRVICEGFN